MRREFKVEVNQGEPQVEYKSFYKNSQHRETYKKQSGRGKFGDIVFRLEPAVMKWMVKFQKDYNLLIL
jgi:elongation factor G